MNINLKGIPTGEFRELSEEEMSGIMKSVEKSSSEANSKPKSTKKKANSWEEIPELKQEQQKKSFKPKKTLSKTGTGKKSVSGNPAKSKGKSGSVNRNARPTNGKSSGNSNTRQRGR